jgi:NitT/TauT family transport system permease protein
MPRRQMLGALGVLTLLAAWQAAGKLKLGGATLPALSQVLDVYRNASRAALLYRSAVATVGSAAQGFVAGSLIGLTLAFVAHLISPLRPGLDRVAALVNAIPAVALGPILIITVGRESTPASLAAIPVFFVIYVATGSGLRSASPRLCEMFTAFGGDRRKRLIYLQIPAALPSLLNGMKVSVTAAMIGAVVGEWFGAPTGLGIVILNTMENFQIPLMWAAVLLVAVLSLAAFGVLSLAENLVARRFS